MTGGLRLPEMLEGTGVVLSGFYIIIKESTIGQLECYPPLPIFHFRVGWGLLGGVRGLMYSYFFPEGKISHSFI